MCGVGAWGLHARVVKVLQSQFFKDYQVCFYWTDYTNKFFFLSHHLDGNTESFHLFLALTSTWDYKHSLLSRSPPSTHHLSEPMVVTCDPVPHLQALDYI